jgi:hypothetical protein
MQIDCYVDYNILVNDVISVTETLMSIHKRSKYYVVDYHMVVHTF